jgi:RNA polymerase sigma-70 factor (ECF subfamily)
MTAEDITEEVFIKAWKAIDSCKGKERTFSSWLYRIAHNHVVDKFRGKRNRLAVEMRIESLPGTSNIEKETEARLEWEQTLEAISRLPEKQKEIIILKFVEGMDNREIEEITGKSQNAIRVLQMRALNTLCQRLHKEG